MTAVNLPKKDLLEMLTYEKSKGRPVYYRNYQKVLEGKFPPETVMRSSKPQTLTKEEIEITDLARYAKEKVEVNEVWEYKEVACIQGKDNEFVSAPFIQKVES